MTETVYIVPGSELRKYHLAHCAALSNSTELREIKKSKLKDSRDLCKVCENGPAFGTDTDRSKWRALVNADPEDISP